jgi:hypothetical protein
MYLCLPVSLFRIVKAFLVSLAIQKRESSWSLFGFVRPLKSLHTLAMKPVRIGGDFLKSLI